MNLYRATGLWLVLCASACASGPSSVRRADALPPGCAVETLGDAGGRPTRSLGEVVARCRGDAADDVPRCTRELQDQACALGATLLWSVTSTRREDTLEMRAFAGRPR